MVEVLLLVLLAAINDLLTYKIKNVLLFTFIIVGLLTNTALCGIHGLIQSLIGILVPITLMPLYITKTLGAGDIKLFCAIGSIMGVGFVVLAIIYAFLLGGILAFFIMTYRKNLRKRFIYLKSYIESCLLSFLVLPYDYHWDKSDDSRFHFSIAVAAGVFMEIGLKNRLILDWGGVLCQKFSLLLQIKMSIT